MNTNIYLVQMCSIGYNDENYYITEGFHPVGYVDDEELVIELVKKLDNQYINEYPDTFLSLLECSVYDFKATVTNLNHLLKPHGIQIVHDKEAWCTYFNKSGPFSIEVTQIIMNSIDFELYSYIKLVAL